MGVLKQLNSDKVGMLQNRLKLIQIFMLETLCPDELPFILTGSISIF